MPDLQAERLAAQAPGFRNPQLGGAWPGETLQPTLRGGGAQRGGAPCRRGGGGGGGGGGEGGN